MFDPLIANLLLQRFLADKAGDRFAVFIQSLNRIRSIE
jgi:hypothetical protein